MKLCIVHLFNSIFSIGVFAELWTITSTRPRIHEPSLITLASSTTTSQPATATQIVLMQNETYPADGAGSRLLSVWVIAGIVFCSIFFCIVCLELLKICVEVVKKRAARQQEARQQENPPPYSLSMKPLKAGEGGKV